MKSKILVFLFVAVVLVFGSGITYSAFYSSATATTTDQHIASFVFNSTRQDHIDISLVDLKPGDVEEYNFTVSNNASSSTSDITVSYQLIAKTLHLMPLTIELYKVTDTDTLLMTCDETYSRNDNNELVCNAPLQEMSYSANNTDTYKLKVTFPSTYNTEEYSNLTDYIDLEIKSWQKTE